MPHYTFALKEKKMVAKETMAFVFEYGDQKFTFRPGQFVDITLEDSKHKDDQGSTRAFSICSSPLDDYLMVATRLTDSAMKKSLAELELGRLVHVDGPLGSFKLHTDKTIPAVMLTGGIGITPFRSIIKDATEQNSEQKLTLIYSNRAPEDAAFVDDLEEWQSYNTNFNFVTRWTKEDGHIDEPFLKKHIRNLAKPIFYVAGPAGMVAGTTQLLIEIGVKEDNIKFEEFAGY
ncbi:MAG: FAD-dependent oxidoreductase [Parcubacteria group bacterium]|nr:FAD-dependent oxidoreductase [Parcubacteria group bacterium]